MAPTRQQSCKGNAVRISRDESWLFWLLFSFWETQSVVEVDPSKLPGPQLLKAVKLSQHSYLSLERAMVEEELAAIREDQVDGFPQLLEDADTGAQVYLWLSKCKEIHLAYRGTETDCLDDIIADIDIPLVPLFPDRDGHQQVLVHCGFHTQFISLKDRIVALLRKHEKDFETIVHTGHSLGAALSMLSAVAFGDMHRDKKHICINIGCPRPGNDRFAALFRALVPERYRIANENDPVPMLAPFTSYQHAEHSITIDDDNFVTFRSEPRGAALRARLVLKDVDWSAAIAADHSCSVYYDRLNAFLSGKTSQGRHGKKAPNADNSSALFSVGLCGTVLLSFLLIYFSDK